MTSGPLDPLDTLLATLSGETWERLRDSMNLAVSFGEETITDLLALDINRKGLKTNTFEQISKPFEAYIGADFEWWVGHDHIGWIRFAVQAKKLVLERQQYNFRHANKGNVQQIDLLENYAKKVRALPIYCLYNYCDNVDSQGHWPCRLRPFEEKDLGCTVVPSRTIRGLVRGYKNFNYLHRFGGAVPWRCLASCPRLRGLLWQQPASEQYSLSPEFLAEFGNFPCFYSQLPGLLRSTDGPILSGGTELDDRIDDEDLYSIRRGNRILPRWVIVMEFSPADLG